ncbi:hypothetical protein BGZ76_005947 [Entomortierella beljakovae]|nr:hypothetical protein BGZ76_005947 [Entomortierella beljakovae]
MRLQSSLTEKLLKKIEIADSMALIGVFAPYMPTPRMKIHFDDDLLSQVMTPITFREPSIDDTAIMRTVRHTGVYELSRDEIMDMTSGILFEESLSNNEHEFILDELSFLDVSILDDLNLISRMVTHLRTGDFYKLKPKLLEKQAVVEFLAPVVTTSFRQVEMVTHVGEIPVTAVSWRNNYKKDPRLDKMDHPKFADIVVTSNTWGQVCIVESSKIDEEKQKKAVEDHWKIARTLQDMWNQRAEKLSFTRFILPIMTTFGI